MQEFDFAIVGAGIAGVSAAYYLAPRAKVVILEREHVPAYHTTGRSAALHSETYGSAEIRAITVATGRFYRNPPQGFADHPVLTPRVTIGKFHRPEPWLIGAACTIELPAGGRSTSAK